MNKTTKVGFSIMKVGFCILGLLIALPFLVIFIIIGLALIQTGIGM